MQSEQIVVRSVSSQVGTAREYETTLVLKPEMNKASIQDLIERVRKSLEATGAQFNAIENWGMRTLAYPIRRNKRGIYLYFRYLGGSASVAELERVLRITEPVLRYLSIRVDDDIDPSARPSDINDAAFEAATESAPDPVEVRREQERQAAEEAANKAAAERAAAEAAAQAQAAEASDAQADTSSDEGGE